MTNSDTRSYDEDKVLSKLKEPKRYSYLDMLYQSYESKELEDKVKATLELFTFGDYSHYVKYSDRFIELDLSLVEKLIKLSLLSIANFSENSTLKINELIEDTKYRLKDGLKDYIALYQSGGDRDIKDVLETLLRSMVDEKLINMKIDDETNSLMIIKSYVLRDAYNSSYKPIVFTADDLEDRSVDKALESLKSWQIEKLDPVCEQFRIHVT